nr:hypothetical protein [Tanacetum cinerariifolium]
PKRVKDSAYHKEKILLCKQAEQGVPLQAEQYDWLADTDEEIDEQELEAHYRYMAKIQKVPTADTCIDSEPLEQVQNDARYNVFANDLQHFKKSEYVSNTCLVETDDSNVIPDSPDMCNDDIQNDQNDVESDDERVALANLKLDVDENKKIQKQLKKENATLAQELKECKTILAKTSKTPGESNSVRDSCLVSLQNKQTEFEKYKAFNDRTVNYDKLEPQRDKDMQKNLALIAKYFKKIYKPTNNNLRTSSNSKNKNVDTTSWYKKDDHSGQFGTQRTVNVAAARENVGSKVVQQSGIQYFNYREFGHFVKECRKPKSVKDSAYHKEKMLLCKQAKQGVPLYMAKIQEVPTADSGTDSEPVKQNEQNDVESDDERVSLANLIANLKLNVDENKKIQKQLKKANTTLAQELKECKAILTETSKSLGESISVRDSFLVVLQTKQTKFKKYKAFNDRTIE